MPSRRVLARISGGIALLALSSIAAAQGSPQGPELGLGTRIVIRFVGTAVVSALLGAALVALDPRYARETVVELSDDPGGAFGWGLLAGIGVPIALVVIAITVIGLLVAIPGFLLLFVLGVVGNAVTVVWVGTLVVGSDGNPGGKTALVGAIAIAVPASIPFLGDLVVAVLEFFGLGVVARRLYWSWRGNDRGRSRGGRY